MDPSLEKLIQIVNKRDHELFVDSGETVRFIGECIECARSKVWKYNVDPDWSTYRIESQNIKYVWNWDRDQLTRNSRKVKLAELFHVLDDIPLKSVTGKLIERISEVPVMTLISSKCELKFKCGQVLAVSRQDLKKVSQLYIDLCDEFGKLREVSIPLEVNDRQVNMLETIIRSQTIPKPGMVPGEFLHMIDVLDYLGIRV